jgi:hypothetical protein
LSRTARQHVEKVDGPATFDKIILQRRSETDFLPPTEDVLSQLTGAAWIWNLPGTAEEKQTFSRNCGAGCHSYQQIMRNRLDERSWSEFMPTQSADAA